MLNKKSIDDINVKGKRVLVRCDFNVPLKEGKITDENRLVAALPTIKKLIADGGKVILCSHLGKPKGEPKPELSLAPVAVRLSELLGQEVKFAADPEVVGPNAKAAVEAMKDGEVVLLENTRYRAEETKNGEAFSKDLASLCDVYVDDAFGTAHRAHCRYHLLAALLGSGHWHWHWLGFGEIGGVCVVVIVWIIVRIIVVIISVIVCVDRLKRVGGGGYLYIFAAVFAEYAVVIYLFSAFWTEHFYPP